MGEILGIWILYVLAAVTPGPNTFLILYRSNNYTRSALAALGITLATSVWVITTVVGLCQVFVLYPMLLTGLKIIGSIYFVYLASQLIGMKMGANEMVSAAASQTTSNPQPKNKIQWLIEGFFTGAANPKSAVLFLTLMGPLICEATIGWRQVVCGLGIILISLGWYQFLAWGVSIPRTRTKIFQVEKYIRPTFSVLCLALAIKLWV